MTALHYLCSNPNVRARDLELLHSKGLDLHKEMNKGLDAVDLLMFSLNMKNVNYTQVASLTRYLIKSMDITQFEPKKLEFI